jgi:hypothetical protein
MQLAKEEYNSNPTTDRGDYGLSVNQPPCSLWFIEPNITYPPSNSKNKLGIL